MTDEVKLLSPAGNYCVVHVLGRKFPGLVFQGDSTVSILDRLNSIDARLIELGVDYEDDARADLDYVRDLLDKVLQNYETVLSEIGMKTPYPTREPFNIKL